MAPHWRKDISPSVNFPVATLETRFKIFSELAEETKPAAPLIFVLSTVTTSDGPKKDK